MDESSPFHGLMESFLAVLGFFAKKKAVNSDQTQAEIQTHPQKPPLGESWEIPSKLLSKTKEKAANHSSDSSPEVTPSTPVFSTDPVMVPPIQTNKALVFEELIADIDRDIHCFDRKDPAGKISIGNQENCSPPFQNGPHIPNTSHSIPQPMEPIQSSPLQDITNHSSPQN